MIKAIYEAGACKKGKGTNLGFGGSAARARSAWKIQGGTGVRLKKGCALLIGSTASSDRGRESERIRRRDAPDQREPKGNQAAF